MLGLRCCGSYQLYQYAGNVPNPGLTRGWQRNSSVRGPDWIMGDGCHVMTPDCVTMLLPPPPSQHLHNPIFRGRSSVWTSAQKWGRENKLSLSLLLLITSWHNVGNKKIWRALTVLLISWRKNCTENDISNLSVSLYFLFYHLSNTDDNIDNYSFSLHYTTHYTMYYKLFEKNNWIFYMKQIFLPDVSFISQNISYSCRLKRRIYQLNVVNVSASVFLLLTFLWWIYFNLQSYSYC